ncbi:hypothetical protein GPA09_33635, partial [Burkholderia pseudomallei]|nr:hypothetical protein [Burkholderia pseudomallei]
MDDMPARERRAVSSIRHCRRAGRHASANRRARAAPVARGIDRDKKRQPGLPQTADEPHVFVSVGFCLSGIRIAGSPRAGSRSCSANRSPDAA